MRRICLPGLPGFGVLLLSLGGMATPVAAQLTELSVEGGGSSVRPPEGLDGEAANFLVGGVRAMYYDLSGSGIMATLQAGWSLDDASGGSFLLVSVQGDVWEGLGTGWEAGLEVKGFGFEVEDPFSYRAFGVEGGPAIRRSGGHSVTTLRGVVGGGSSSTELVPRWGTGGTTLEETLWRYGGTLEWLGGGPGGMAGMAVGIHETPAGRYESLGGRLLFQRGDVVVEARLDRWNTPTGPETTGGITLVIPVDGWSVRGFLGKSEPDPLTLTQPGNGSGGITVGKRIWANDPVPRLNPPLHSVLSTDKGVSRIRIRVDAPGEPGRVEVLGDFTFWDGLPMERDGDGWILELSVLPGTYHYGFLVDGEWFLPGRAPGVVADEWGRENATLVIEG